MSAEYQSLADAIGIPDPNLKRAEDTGWRLLEDKRYREAAAVFRGLTILEPENIDLYRGHALAAAKGSDLVEAAEALEHAVYLLERAPGREHDLGQLLAVLSSILYRSGRRSEAQAAAARSLEVSPADAPWRAALEDGLSRVERISARTRGTKPEEAESFRRAIRARLTEVGKGHGTIARALGYGDQELLRVFDSGSTLMESGDASRAKRVFEGLIALDGEVPLFHLALARAKEAASDLGGAKRAYDEAVAAARKIEGGVDVLADAVLRRAAYFLRQGDKRRAERDLRGVKTLPKSALTDALRSRFKDLWDAAGLGRNEESAASSGIRSGSGSPFKKKKEMKTGRSKSVGQAPTSRPNAKP